MSNALAALTISRVISISVFDGVAYVPFLPFGLICLTYRLPKPEAPVLVTVGDHVRLRRKVLGLTQTEAAQAIGVCLAAVARWETEPREPIPRLMPPIIRFLGYDPQPPAQSFAELVGRTRRTLGMNQSEIARALGLPAQTLRRWERGQCEPKAMQKLRVEASIEEMLAIVTEELHMRKRRSQGSPHAVARAHSRYQAGNSSSHHDGNRRGKRGG